MSRVRDPRRETQQDYKPSREWKPGRNVVPTSDIKALAEKSRSIAMPDPDDAEYAELTGVDETDKRDTELEALRRRIDRLEATLNAAAWEINEHNKFLTNFRAQFGKMLHYPWYRFIMWLWPLPLPAYREGKTVPYITRQDRRPAYGDPE